MTRYVLTPAQEKFAVHYAAHGRQAKAYRFAFGEHIKSNAASERGRVLLKNQAVRDRIADLRGAPMPQIADARDPRKKPPPLRSTKASESDPAEAVTSLAAVVACPAIPPAHRLQSISLLRGMLSRLAEELGEASPLPCTDCVRELRTHENGGSMVGEFAGRENSASTNGRH